MITVRPTNVVFASRSFELSFEPNYGEEEKEEEEEEEEKKE